MHLVPLIDCTKVDGDSDFDLNKIKQGGERQRNRQIQPEPCQGIIRELRKKWYCKIFCTYSTRGIWCYGYPYLEKIVQHTASTVGKLQGQTPLELLTGETFDISEYLDFGWYDRV